MTQNLQNRIVGQFFGNMDRNQPNYTELRTWQASTLIPDTNPIGCYPGQMSGAWVSEAVNAVNSQKDPFGVGSHPLAHHFKTAAAAAVGASSSTAHNPLGFHGAHTGQIVHPSYGGAPAFSDHVVRNTDQNAHGGYPGINSHSIGHTVGHNVHPGMANPHTMQAAVRKQQTTAQKTKDPNKTTKKSPSKSKDGKTKGGKSGLGGGFGNSDSYHHYLDPDAPHHNDKDSEKMSAKDMKKTKAMEAREALNRGEEHTNPKGKVIRARKMGDGCEGKSCRFRCEDRISRDARNNIFKYFWKLGNHQLQWLFIAMHTSVRAPKQRTQDPVRSRRKTSRSYFFRLGTEKVPVCKTMFLQTLDVSDSWVDTAISKAANGIAVAPDCRGRHTVKRKTPEQLAEARRMRRRRKKNKLLGGDPSVLGGVMGSQDSHSGAAHLPLQESTNRCGQNSDKGPKGDGSQMVGPDVNSISSLGNNAFQRLEAMQQEGMSGGDCNPSELDLLSPRIDLRVGGDSNDALPSWASVNVGGGDGNGASGSASGSGMPSPMPGVIMWMPGVMNMTQEAMAAAMGQHQQQMQQQQQPPPPKKKKNKRPDASIALGAVATGMGVGVGGLLGAEAVPDQFLHHLDPCTLGLKELPNGAVITPDYDYGDMPSPKRPKRNRDPKKWRANQCKEALNTGKEHINTKGKLVRGRQMKEGCGENCRFRCQDRITPEEREAIFQHFWSLGDHGLQWLFISRHTKVREPKHRTTTGNPEQSRRKTSRSYFFTVFEPEAPTVSVTGRKTWRVRDDEVPVCKTMFLHTIDVSDSWVESAVGKVRLQQSPEEVTILDERGKHGKRKRRLPDNIVESVRQHLALFPRSGIPPQGKGFQRKCLADGHSVSKMHRMYLEWLQLHHQPGTNVTPATLRQYRDILGDELRAEFKIPKQEMPDEDDLMEEMEDMGQDDGRGNDHIWNLACNQNVGQ